MSEGRSHTQDETTPGSLNEQTQLEAAERVRQTFKANAARLSEISTKTAHISLQFREVDEVPYFVIPGVQIEVDAATGEIARITFDEELERERRYIRGDVLVGSEESGIGVPAITEDCEPKPGHVFVPATYEALHPKIEKLPHGRFSSETSRPDAYWVRDDRIVLDPKSQEILAALDPIESGVFLQSIKVYNERPVSPTVKIHDTKGNVLREVPRLGRLTWLRELVRLH